MRTAPTSSAMASTLIWHRLRGMDIKLSTAMCVQEVLDSVTFSVEGNSDVNFAEGIPSPLQCAFME